MAKAAIIMAALVAVGGCDTAEQATGLDPTAAVVAGKVTSVSSAGTAAASSSANPLEGIEVMVEGSSAYDVTAADGSFRLEVEADEGPLRIRFRRGTLDVELELAGIPAGAELRIAVRLEDSGAILEEDDEMEDDGTTDDDGLAGVEFEGVATLETVVGETPTRTATVTLATSNGTAMVEVSEDATRFAADGDVVDFPGMLAALQEGSAPVRIEGHGSAKADGSVHATDIKVQIDGDDGVPDDGVDDEEEDFHGAAVLLLLEGEAPARVALIEVSGALGTTLVRVVEGVTTFAVEGDVTGFPGMLDALDRSDLRVTVEGDGTLDDEGIFSAVAIKVETSEDS